ncbi:MAG: glycosyltransferase family 4 protein [Planctomycetota bacterium]|nr:glycosyltransferase family 4 protein [Planctomycetota bacterium]
MNWIVSQIGRRQHYAIPRALLRRGMLSRFYTDAWVDASRPLLARAPGGLRALASRHHPEMPRGKVVGFTAHSVYDAVYDRLKNPYATPASASLRYRDLGRRFALATARHILARKFDPAQTVFFGFNTSSLEVIRPLRERGVLTIVDQIDPAKVEEDLLIAEGEKWPGWEATPGRASDEYWARMRDEWAAAHVVYVNSLWTKSALLKQGVPAEKIVVVPIAFEAHGAGSDSGGGNEPAPASRAADRDRPLVVLWLGAVVIRKGIQYLIEAARRLKDANIRFEIFAGRAFGDQVAAAYRQADVFVLPTLSDGFAITQLEAMGHGLPVVTTGNCGEVVEDGVDGLIVPAGDGEALAAAFAKLEADRPRIREMSQNALKKAGCFTLDRIGAALEEIARTRKV